MDSGVIETADAGVAPPDAILFDCGAEEAVPEACEGVDRPLLTPFCAGGVGTAADGACVVGVLGVFEPRLHNIVQHSIRLSHTKRSTDLECPAWNPPRLAFPPCCWAAILRLAVDLACIRRHAELRRYENRHSQRAAFVDRQAKVE